MARRKKSAPEAAPMNITLTNEDLLAKGHELAKRVSQINALRKQAQEYAASMRSLIDNELDLVKALCAQIEGGTEAKNQATLTFGEATPATAALDHEITDPLPTLTPADSERIREEKIAEGLVAPVLTTNGIQVEEIDLSAAKAKNGRAMSKVDKQAKTAKGPKQPPKPSGIEPVIVATAPSSCPDCGGKVNLLDASGLYGCADQHTLGCQWLALVEQIHVTQALGAHA